MLFSLSKLSRHSWPAGLVGLLFVASEAVAQSDVADRYQVQIVEREMRSYFAELSDSEYASLEPGPMLFPLLINAWPTLPLALSDVFSYDSPSYTRDGDVRFQDYLLESDLGPSKRSKAIVELAASRSPLAAVRIARHLESEKDPFVIADCLRQLHRMKLTTLGNAVVPYLTSAHGPVRFHAAALYGLQDEAQINLLLRQATQERDAMIRRRMLEVAANRAREARFDEWLPFWRSEDPLVRLSTMRALLQFSNVHELQGELLEISQSNWLSGKQRLAGALHNRLNPEFCDALLTALATDENVAVRAAVASAVGRLQLPNLQPLLTRLADDSQATVRLEVARSLARFANEEAFHALVKLSGDQRSVLVQQAARDSLIAIAGPFRVDVSIGIGIDSDNVATRHVAYQVVSKLGTDLHRQAIARQLAREERPENIAQAILALARGDGRNASEQVLTFARHESPAVRGAVAEAIGALRITAGKPLLTEYALSDPQQQVRTPAIRAMGLLGDAQFSAPMLQLLQRTRVEAPDASSEEDRAMSCWSIARLQEVDKTVLDRVVAMVTRAVISTQMGPMYDSDAVRVSAAWCIVDLARRGVEVTGFNFSTQAPEVIAMLKRMDPTTAEAAAQSMPAPTSDMLRAFGAELESFYENQPIHRVPVPASTTRFSFFSYQGRN